MEATPGKFATHILGVGSVQTGDQEPYSEPLVIRPASLDPSTIPKLGK
jgi:hypothetical protein